MKRVSTIVMALVMVMTMAQCKKNEETNLNKTVTITLDVKNNNNSKVVVNPATGTVDFETGDKVYVGSGGKYVGFLTHNGTNFVGNITNPIENQPLQFYFLGNVTPAETLTSGVTESCSIVISDQTQHLPVISAAPSYENYTASMTNYTANLLNKCALVKFNVSTTSEAAICVIGFNNKVTVNFMENTLTNSLESNGVITLPAGNGEKWAILLPQEAMEAGEQGSAYSQDGVYTGTRGAVPTITENGYLTVGIPVVVTTEINQGGVPTGAINGLFTINANGDQVYFSRGNLQYQASTNTWRFAENQWDYVGDAGAGTVFENGIKCNNILCSPTYDGWIDLFAWGTSGYDHGAVCYQPWSTSSTHSDYYAYGLWNANLYDQTGQADWGYNPIINGGNQENQWRTLTNDEWYNLFFTRTTTSGIRFVRAVVNEVFGIVVLPDNWDASIYDFVGYNSIGTNNNENTISIFDWETILEPNGVAFLPGAGRRDYSQSWIDNAGYICNYWTATHYDDERAYFIDWYLFGAIIPSSSPRGTDRAVRLVHDVE